MSDDNVWAAGTSERETKEPETLKPASFSYRGDKPNVGEVLGYVFKDIGDNSMAYVWAGLPNLAYICCIFGGLILGVMLLVFGMIATGVDPDSPEFVFWILGFEATFLLIIPVGYFFQVGTFRAIWWHLSGQEELSWSSGFRATLTKPGHTIGLAFLTVPLMLVGLLMCYLPALAVLLWLHLAICIMIVDEVGPITAYKKAFRLFQKNPGYHSKMVGMGTLLEIAIMQIPVVGWIAGYPIGGAMHLVAYRESQRETEDT